MNFDSPPLQNKIEPTNESQALTLEEVQGRLSEIATKHGISIDRITGAKDFSKIGHDLWPRALVLILVKSKINLTKLSNVTNALKRLSHYDVVVSATSILESIKKNKGPEAYADYLHNTWPAQGLSARDDLLKLAEEVVAGMSLES